MTPTQLNAIVLGLPRLPLIRRAGRPAAWLCDRGLISP
jgi:hypothetical protein